MPKQISLTQEKFALVDDDMYAFLSRWNWYCGPSGYAVRGTRASGKYQNIFLHRVVAHLIFGDIPEGYEVDHRDSDRLNCTTSNLRLATRLENSFNKRKAIGFTSTYKGVYWKKSLGKWAAKIQRQHLGYFVNEIEAALAWDAVAKETYGEFAKLNFPG